jgi:hypothetical protein
MSHIPSNSLVPGGGLLSQSDRLKINLNNWLFKACPEMTGNDAWDFYMEVTGNSFSRIPEVCGEGFLNLVAHYGNGGISFYHDLRFENFKAGVEKWLASRNSGC